MYHQPQYFVQQGWECPKCKRVYSPTTPMCFTCPQEIKSNITSGTTNICLQFVPDTVNSSATTCMRCGKEKHQHLSHFTNL